MTGRDRLIARFGGFSLVGVANTLLSMVAIFVMNEWCGMDCRISYVVAYVLTVLVAYVANARLVFRVRLSVRGAAMFFAAYLSGMILGTLLLAGGRRLLPSMNATLLSYMVILVTMVWNFFFVNKSLSRGGGPHLEGDGDGER